MKGIINTMAVIIVTSETEGLFPFKIVLFDESEGGPKATHKAPGP
jgi:hypothetical protein